MLVACSLVNLTTWDVARHAFEWLHCEFYTPRELAMAKEEDLHEALKPLGLWRRRSKSLIRLANAWLLSPPKSYLDVLELPGCGKYASDSWAIFMEGRSDVQASDGKLLWHLEQLREREHGREDGRSEQVGPPPHGGAGGGVQREDRGLSDPG